MLSGSIPAKFLPAGLALKVFSRLTSRPLDALSVTKAASRHLEFSCRLY